MSTWNYRATVTLEPDGLGGSEEVYAIREVYYDDAGQMINWSKDSVAPGGDSWMSLGDDLVKMQRAIAHPVVDLTGDKPTERTRRRKAER